MLWWRLFDIWTRPPMNLQTLRDHFPYYLALIRFDRPIGTWLVLWPALWALWLAADGMPDWQLIVIFSLGAFLMRSAGCAINDFADRNIDGDVSRTRERPLATGKISAREAIGVFVVLSLLAFVLVLQTNALTVYLSLGAVALASCYPFMKRYTHLPQVVLGAAFAWSVPMAFAAQTNSVPAGAWLVYTAVVVWTVVYDTFYAMVDREDDLKIGVKSTAVLFGDDDRLITAGLQILVIVILVLIGSRFGLGLWYFLSVAVAAGLFAWQQYHIRDRDRGACFEAFLHNRYVGMTVWLGIAVDTAVNTFPGF